MTKLLGSTKGAMPFLEHIEELRWRIIKSFVVVLLASIGVYFFWDKIFEAVLVFPIKNIHPRPKIVFMQPTEAFLTSVKISFFGGLFISLPFVLFQIWRFIAPALFEKERRFSFLIVLLTLVSFYLGVGFSFYAIPRAIAFLAGFQTASLTATFAVNSYVTFILKLTLAFGLVFQMPAVAIILTKAGLVTYKKLLGYWRISIVVIFVIAAILTPPDIISQIFMAVPLLILYAVSIGLSWIVGRKGKE